MAPMKEKVSSNNIPDDVAFDILSKLPVKSLKRFSCVQKSWANLFENPRFMSMYRNNFISKHDDDNSRILLKQSMPRPVHDNLVWLTGEAFENRIKLDWPPPFQEDDAHICICGCVDNGILCLYQDRDCPAPAIPQKYVLWNPVTKEFKVIPSGSIHNPPAIRVCVFLQGFGHDPVADDYKLIRCLLFHNDDYYGNFVSEHIWQIYSLRSNSWRNLDIEMPNIPQYDTQVYLNGVCSWLTYLREYSLVSFNLSDEVFHITPLVEHTCDATHRFIRIFRLLVVLKGSIAMITSYSDTVGFDISILGELGVKESWTKLFSFGPLPCVMRPIGFGKKGNLFLGNDGGEMVRFDLSSQIIENLDIKGVYPGQMVIFKESLLPIGRLHN